MSNAMVAIPLATGATATVRVSNILPSAIASELLAFFDSAVAAAGAAFACKIVAAHRGWLSRGYGTVQFDSSAAAIFAADLASSGRLPPFLGSRLSISPAHVDILPRAPDLSLRFAGASLILGNRVAERELEVAYTWDGVRAEIILAKRRVDLYLEHDSRKYRLEVLFEDIRECFGCNLDETGAILLQEAYTLKISKNALQSIFKLIRPHPNECSGGDLDGDLFFITWDDKLIPEKVDAPMDYAATRPRIMDHVVTLEEIQKNFVDYMINDTLGAISTAHLIHADRNPLKARSPECLQLAALHSMSVDFAKTGAPAEMPQSLRPREYPDFMERWEKPMYVSNGPMGKLYRAALRHAENSDALLPEAPASRAYDPDLEVPGFREFLDAAEECYELYAEKLGTLMSYYSAEAEDEILTGNIRNKQLYLKRDNKRYFDMKDRIVAAVEALHDEVRGWLRDCPDASRMASAWYHVTYHPDRRGEKRLWSFPWIACDNLLAIKEARGCRRQVGDAVPMDCDA
ncbi:hypothetical protein PR202_gb15355 [Eleusine coracana subsp. coracana]|uniref:RNA-dependent RNA polymerase n=1 Tax=Eleusine coracana subsp. coracana TaxID=191504 RepID=A0AAV5EVE1_ELECO|nr:hypothetical protein PR202_gb15355 [Eleusine coracana subsp. coracana]